MSTILKWGVAISISAVAIIFLFSRSSFQSSSADKSLEPNPQKIIKVIRPRGG